MSASDAVAMSADPDAVALLSRLAAEGMLVIASSGGSGDDIWPTTFTYHPLLVELLRRRVMVGAEDHALYAAAQVRVVQHHLMHGDPASALHYAARVDDKRWLVRLLCEHAIGLLATGHRAVVAQALAAVPDQRESEIPAITAIRALERRIAHDTTVAVRLATEAIRAADATTLPRAAATPAPKEPWTPEQFERTLHDATLILRCWLARAGVGSRPTRSGSAGRAWAAPARPAPATGTQRPATMRTRRRPRAVGCSTRSASARPGR